MNHRTASIAVCLAIGISGHAQLVINEVCSRNSTVWQAPDGGHPDWVEVMNAGPEEVHLEDFFLSDSPSNPTKWRFPAAELEPGELLVVHSSGTGSNGFPFSIDGEGETIVLADGSGNIQQLLSVPPLQPDHSYGAGPTSGSGPYWFADPTPGSPNSTTPYLGYAPEPTFSRAPGFVEAGSFITATASTGIVRWSWNGREPSGASPVAGVPISIDSTMIFLARTYADQLLPSPVVSATYIRGQPGNFPVVSLAVDPDSMFHEEFGMYMPGPNADPEWPHYGANYWQDRSLPAHVEFYEVDGVRYLDQQVDVQIHGGRRSRTNAQRPLRLTARSKYGSDVMQHRFFPERPDVDKFHTLVLRNSGGDFCLSNFRDGLFHQLSLHNHLDIDELAFRPAVAYVNGSYWGIVEIRERIDEEHLHFNYGADMDSVLMMEEENISMQGDTVHFWNLREFVRTHDLDQPGNWAFVDSLLDVKSAKDYFALEMQAGNVDWPSNNLKYWKPSVTEGKWRYILYDLDATMVLYGWIPEDLNMFYWTFTHRAGFVHSELFRGLMTNREFKRTFLNRLADLMNTALSPARFQAEVDGITSVYAGEIERHFQRWGCWFPFYEDHAFNIIPHFAQYRDSYMRQHAMAEYGFPNAPLLEFDVFPPTAGDLLINTITPSLPFAGYYFNGNAIDVTAEPTEGYVFDHWGYSEDHTTSTELHWKRSFHSDGTVTAYFRSTTSELQVFPNPATDELSIGFESKTPSTARITVSDPAGRSLQALTLGTRSGVNKAVLDLSTVQRGVLFISIDVDGERSTTKVLKL